VECDASEGNLSTPLEHIRAPRAVALYEALRDLRCALRRARRQTWQATLTWWRQRALHRAVARLDAQARRDAGIPICVSDAIQHGTFSGDSTRWQAHLRAQSSAQLKTPTEQE
jgi:hypothetical protein